MMETHEEKESSLQDAEEPLNFAKFKSSLSELSLPVPCTSPSSMEFSSSSAVSLCKAVHNCELSPSQENSNPTD